MEERLRRTMMFVPGNNAGMVKDAGIYGADSIMFDLEDSVSMSEKDAARMLVYEALQTQDMKTHRYPDGAELEFARNMILHAARAAGIAAFDTVFTNMNDVEGFQRETEHIHELGFDGKSLVNPRQIDWVNKVYEPTKKEIENALDVEAAIEEAHQKGSGVISMNGQMVDRPVVLRAQRVIRLAKASNLINEEGEYIEK